MKTITLFNFRNKNSKLSLVKNKRPDFIMLACMVFLVVLGVIMVYSASFYTAQKDYSDSFFFFKKQLLGVAAGIIGFIGMFIINPEFFKKIKWYLLIVAVVLLILVFIPLFSVEAYGAKRWINLGIITVQPSEIAKFAFVIFAACYMDSCKTMTTIKGALPVLITGIAMCALIILEPNMSITMCMALIMLCMVFIGGLPIKKIILILLPFIAAIPILILIEPYRISRFMAFLDPWASPKNEGYQLIQSYYALGSGGWFGVGLFNSRQKFEFLPFSESDFIFSIIGEEFGFFGSLIVIAVFLVLIYRGIKTAINAKDRFHCYLAAGIVCVIAIQVMVNLAVVTGSIPPTGLPLPFISYGGSSLAMFMGAGGLLLNISRQSKGTAY